MAEYPYLEPITAEENYRWNMHPYIQHHWWARFFRKLGLYKPYRAWLLKRGYQNPFAAVLKITARCTLDCKHCPWHSNDEPDLDTHTWKQLLDDFYEKGAMTVVFEGGEPTLRSDLPQLISHAQSKNMDTIVITNGTVPLDRIAPSNFWFSIEGPPEIHNQIRGKDSFQRMLPQLKSVQERGYKALAVVTLSRVNYRYIPPLLEILRPLVHSVMLNFMYPYKGSEHEALSQTELHLCVEQILKLKKHYPEITNSVVGLKKVAEGKGIQCYPWWNIHARHDGTVIHDCTVRLYERYDCSQCNLTCYNETYVGAQLNPASLRAYLKYRGV
jgi:Fe-coproporphyrin III synthase